jgi:hypothetical protein
MKIIFALWILISLNAFANDPNFDSTSNIITLPRVTIDNENTFNNVKLLLLPDGTWDILHIEDPEDGPSLTGDYFTSVSSDGLSGSYGRTICVRATTISLIQNGKNLSGTGKISKCEAGNILGGIGNINGVINGKDISFEITTENETFTYTGRIIVDALFLETPSAWDTTSPVLETFHKIN